MTMNIPGGSNSEILKYLERNFLSLRELVAVSGMSAANIKRHIRASYLPAHSYRLDERGRLHSFFGVRENVGVGGAEILFFNRTHVGKIEAMGNESVPDAELADKLRDAFYGEYVVTLEACRTCDFDMAEFFPRDRGRSDSLRQLLASEWKYYLDGTYGLCTLRNDAAAIATKEAMIRKINLLTAERTRERIPEGDARQQLSAAIDLLDQVSSDFAPHELSVSSRFKYVVALRERYGLSDLRPAHLQCAQPDHL